MLKTVYVCDHCGAEMVDWCYKVTLVNGTFNQTAPVDYHYCIDCGRKVKEYLKEGGSVIKIAKDGCFVTGTTVTNPNDKSISIPAYKDCAKTAYL